MSTATSTETFDTPGPIEAHVEIGVGEVRLHTGERADTVVTVRPTDEHKSDDVAAAERAKVEFAAGRLSVKAIRRWKSLSPFSDGGSVDVTIDLPAGSRLTAQLAAAALRCTGPIGDCSISTSLGAVRLGDTGALRLHTGAGDVTVGRATGDAQLITGTGSVRVAAVDGAVVLKNSNGDSEIGEVTGELKASVANGNVTVGRAHAGLTVKAANGDVRVDGITRGTVSLVTACGDIEVGIREGTAARLDLGSRAGVVRNELTESDGPAGSEHTAEIHARTSLGDVLIRRAGTGEDTAANIPANTEGD